jgi:hypothetical protein
MGQTVQIIARHHTQDYSAESDHARNLKDDKGNPAPEPTRCNTHIMLEVEAPDSVTLVTQADIHLPSDFSAFGHQSHDHKGAGTAVVNFHYTRPAHAPESRGHKPGPRGHRNPEVEILVTASDGGVYPITSARALLHPNAWQTEKSLDADPVTGTPFRLALIPTDGALN